MNRPDPIVIEGRRLLRIKGAQIDRIGVFAFRSAGLEPIPFQIDEKASTGRGKTPRFVLEPETDPDPNFDDDDELVVIARDLGMKWDGLNPPPEAKELNEISVIDPSSGADVAYAYVIVFGAPPPVSDVDYIDWDARRRSVISEGRYEVGYPENDAFFFNKMAISPANGGSGDNFVDVLKMRANGRLLAQLFEYDITNSDWRNDLVAVKDGPIRVIRRVRTRMNGSLFSVHKNYVDVIYYPGFFSMEVPVSMGIKPVPLLYRADLRLSLDLAGDAPPMAFFSERNPISAGAVADGVMTDAEKKLDIRPSKWLCLTGPDGTVLMRLDQKPGSRIYQDLYYYDDSGDADPPEEFPGHRGDSGFYMERIDRERASKRIYKLTFAFPSSGSEEQVASFLSVWDKPLDVRVQGGIDVSQQQAPPLYPDSREASPRPTYMPPSIKTKTRGYLPQFSVDPNVGYGTGIVIVERKTFGTGLSSDIGFLLTNRLHQFHRIEEIYENLGPISELRLYLRYMQHPNQYFFGIGNDQTPDDLVVYRREQMYGHLLLERNVTEWLVASLSFDVEHNWIGHGELFTRFEPSIEQKYGPPEKIEGTRLGPEVYGLDGGWTNSVDIAIALDFRDDEYYPTRGTFDTVGIKIIPAWLGSDYEYNQYRIDLRYYYGGRLINFENKDPRNLWLRYFTGSNIQRVLAFRLFMQRTDAALVDFAGRTVKDIPFYNQSSFGGATISRGHYDGQWIDNDVTFVQVELRWRFWKIADGTLFYDTGRVWEDISDRDEWERCDWSDIHSSYGLGLVWHIIPDIVMRMNYGFSKENPGGLLYVWAFHTF